MKFISYLTISAVNLLFILACSAPNSDQEEINATFSVSKPVKVTTTIAQIADVVKNVGDERVEIEFLCGPGVDPHLYKASQSDIAKLSNSDLILYNGLMLEGRMIDILEKINFSGKSTVAVSDAIPKELLIEPEGYQGHYDPHIWMDVSLWSQTIPLIVAELSTLDLEGKEFYQEKAKEYQKQLDELHQELKEKMATIPQERRVLVTAHDAFGYFGRAYDIEVMGLQGISTTSEYGLQDLKRLIDVIVSRGVKAVFVESSVPPRSIEALVAGCRERGHEIKIGGELFSDAMGNQGTEEGTYIGMIHHNVNTIVESLR